jgi:hypothetical protein
MTAAPVLPAESRHTALQCRDRAALLRDMDRIANPPQTSEGTAKLLEQAAEEIQRLSGVYISAVKGRQAFRECVRDLRHGVDRIISLIHNLPRSATADQIDQLAIGLLNRTASEDATDHGSDIVLYEATKALANFCRRSLDAGPITKSPGKEAFLWRNVRDALEKFEADNVFK